MAASCGSHCQKLLLTVHQTKGLCFAPHAPHQCIQLAGESVAVNHRFALLLWISFFIIPDNRSKINAQYPSTERFCLFCLLFFQTVIAGKKAHSRKGGGVCVAKNGGGPSSGEKPGRESRKMSGQAKRRSGNAAFIPRRHLPAPRKAFPDVRISSASLDQEAADPLRRYSSKSLEPWVVTITNSLSI